RPPAWFVDKVDLGRIGVLVWNHPYRLLDRSAGEQKLVARIQIQCGTLKQYPGRIRPNQLRLDKQRSNSIPFGAGLYLLYCLKRLSGLARSRHALHLSPNIDRERRQRRAGGLGGLAKAGRLTKSAGGFIERKSQVRRCRDAGTQLIADQTRKFEDRPALCCG